LGDTPEGYGGATPPSTPGGIPPGSAKPVTDINEALATMAQAITDSSKLTRDLVAHLERANATVTKTGQSFDYAHTELKSLLKDTANLEYSMKRIQKLQAARVGGGSTKSGTIEYVKNLQAEYKVLLQVLNTGKGQGRYVKDVEKALEGLDKKLKQVQKQNDRTWDSRAIQDINTELAETARRVEAVRKSMDKIQVDKMSKGFKDLGRAVDDAFGGQLSNTLQRIPGISGAMKAMRLSQQAGVAHRAVGKLGVERAANTQAAWKANARLVYQQHGRSGIQAMRNMGYAGGAPVPGTNLFGTTFKSRGRGTRMLGQAQGQGGVAATKGGSLDQMTVKTLVVQNMQTPGAKPKLKMDSKTGKFLDAKGISVDPATGQPEVEATTGGGRRGFRRPGTSDILANLRGKAGAPTSLEDVQNTMNGSGGLFSRTLNKLVGGMAEKEGGGFLAKGAQSLLSQGAGSAVAGLGEGAVGVGSSVLRGGLGLASRAAVPLALAGALVSLRDKVAEENKKIEGTFAGQGGFATGGSDDFSNIRKSMLSTGMSNNLRMGQGVEENMKIMATLGEGGLATGGTMRRGQDLKANLDDKRDQGLAGGGFYGSVMKNAVYNGKNLGMNQDSSVRLTMKLIEKFGQTTQETQKFFVGLDDMMQHSGVSAGKYVEVIEEITGQFNEMNRSLNMTLGLLNTVGKDGRMTGDAMKDMVKTLTAPTQMSTAQRMYNARGMIDSGDAASVAEGLDNSTAKELQELAASLKSRGVGDDLTGGSSGGDIQGNRAKIEQFLTERFKDKPEELKAALGPMEDKLNRVTSQQAQSQALKSGDASRVASAVEMGGESSPMAMMAHRANLRHAGEIGSLSKDKLARLLAGDQGVLQEVMQNPAVNQAQRQNVLASGENLTKSSQAMRQIQSIGATMGVGFGREGIGREGGKDAAAFLGGDESDRNKFQTMLELQKARIGAGYATERTKKDGSEDSEAMVNDFIEASTKNVGEVTAQLAGLDTTFKLVTTMGSALQKAVEADTSQRAADAAKSKAQSIADNTRTSAEIFAKSFEYLFNKLINMMDKMMDVLSPKWFDYKQNKGWAEDRSASLLEGLEGMDTSKFTPEQQTAYQANRDKLRSGAGTTGTSAEMDATHKTIAAFMDEASPGSGTAALQKAYAKQKVDDAEAMDNAYAKHGAAKDSKTMSEYLATYDDEDRGGGKYAVGNALKNLVGDETTGAGLQGSITEISKIFRDVRQTQNGDHLAVTTSTQGATNFMEEALKKFPEYVTKNTEGSKTTYNVFGANYINAPPPKGEAKGGEKPAVVTEPQK
jgi:hypothetical protein